MPFNYQSLRQRLHEINKNLPARKLELQAKRDVAFTLLENALKKEADLAQKIADTAQSEPNLRCAIPLQLDFMQPVPPPQPSYPSTLVAVDGSQILPDRHAAFQYAVVNIGLFIFKPGSSEAPIEQIETQVFYDQDLYQPDGSRLSNEQINLQRDLRERQIMVELAGSLPAPLLALSDGPLELFREPLKAKETESAFGDFIAALQQLRQQNVMTAGYVDRTLADLLIRTLEVSALPEQISQREVREQMGMLRGVHDIDLLAGHLPYGHRTQVFALQSNSSRFYTADIALHFFYLNMGSMHNNLVRVEIPAWMAENVAALDLVHHTLLEQAKILGVSPYPYALHRAHEIAILTRQDKQYIEDQLQAGALQYGGYPHAESAKQVAKNSFKTKSRSS